MRTSYLVAIVILAIVIASNADFVNSKVKRRIEANSNVVRVTIALDYQQTSGNEKLYRLTLANPSSLAFISVSVKGVALNTTFAGYETLEGNSYGNYDVLLSETSSGKLKVFLVYSHTLKPFPEKIGQSEKQFVVLRDNHYFFSPYKTNEQTTTVETFSSVIESHSEEKPTSVSGSKVTYGSYSDVKAYSNSPLRIHFENNAPFLTVQKFVRTVEISHWGNVAVEDSFDIVHSGALLKGTFSRADYQRNPTGSPSHIPTMRAILPAGAVDVYYRDNIGNISSSNFNELAKNGPTLDFQTRTPLFGGWKIKFEIGFNLPSEQYLFRDYSDSSKYLLNISFVADLEHAVYDEVEVRFILPEGVRNPTTVAPFDFQESRTRQSTYLDTTGREVLVLSRKNVVAEHNKPISVLYYFSKSSMFQEPFILILTFFALFLGIMVSTRFSYRIGEQPVVEAPVVAVPVSKGRK